VVVVVEERRGDHIRTLKASHDLFMDLAIVPFLWPDTTWERLNFIALNVELVFGPGGGALSPIPSLAPDIFRCLRSITYFITILGTPKPWEKHHTTLRGRQNCLGPLLDA